jgi:hypothetical protein
MFAGQTEHSLLPEAIAPLSLLSLMVLIIVMGIGHPRRKADARLHGLSPLI